MSKTRAGGAVAAPLTTTSTTGTDGNKSTFGTQEVYAPLKTSVESQHEHGKHCLDTRNAAYQSKADKLWGY